MALELGQLSAGFEVKQTDRAVPVSAGQHCTVSRKSDGRDSLVRNLEMSLLLAEGQLEDSERLVLVGPIGQARYFESGIARGQALAVRGKNQGTDTPRTGKLSPAFSCSDVQEIDLINIQFIIWITSRSFRQGHSVRRKCPTETGVNSPVQMPEFFASGCFPEIGFVDERPKLKSCRRGKKREGSDSGLLS
jgi:hypothetical protein